MVGVDWHGECHDEIPRYPRLACLPSSSLILSRLIATFFEVLEIFESCENRMEETLWVSLSYSTFVFAYWQFLGDIYETNYELQMISPILYYLVFLTPVATFSCHQMVIFPATYVHLFHHE